MERMLPSKIAKRGDTIAQLDQRDGGCCIERLKREKAARSSLARRSRTQLTLQDHVVMVQGRSGHGKQSSARATHSTSHRRWRRKNFRSNQVNRRRGKRRKTSITKKISLHSTSGPNIYHPIQGRQLDWVALFHAIPCESRLDPLVLFCLILYTTSGMHSVGWLSSAA